jgi:rSAM/selenodomain-associated transferase 2
VKISIVIPTLNEEAGIGRLLSTLRQLPSERCEIIVVDGDSSDGTAGIAAAEARVLRSERGRGRQQAAGAAVATGEVLWFLHADCVPGPEALEAIRQALSESEVAGGNFGLCFDGGGRPARHLTVIYPWLRRLGICYGDSGIFVRRSVYERVGGFRSYALFEDLDLVSRVRKIGRFQTIDCTLTTSSRRFEGRSFSLIFARWTLLQILFWMGVHPDRLARLYPAVRREVK